MNIKPKITQSNRNRNIQDVVKDGFANNHNPVDTHPNATIDYPPLKNPILPELWGKMMAGSNRFKKSPPRLMQPPVNETLYSPTSLPTIVEKYTTGVKKYDFDRGNKT